MKEKVNDIKNFKQGFTLLELLVVVVIIGILAGIALPQYQMAVGKVRFSTLKNITKSIQESAQRYYLVNNKYPRKTADLDIDLEVLSEGFKYSAYLNFDLKSALSCSIWDETHMPNVACGREIFGKKVVLYLIRETGKPAKCMAESIDKNDIPNKICQKETSKKPSQAFCLDTYCYYEY